MHQYYGDPLLAQSGQSDCTRVCPLVTQSGHATIFHNPTVIYLIGIE
jgi:hypothetical protein